MVDATSMVALVVALIALLVTGAQLAQQLLATGYVIRKCDRVISGGVTKGGVRNFHWRQFRYTVRYEVLTFALPMPVYESLGISPAIVVENPGADIYSLAEELKPKRTTSQGAWVSFVQDMLPCLGRQSIGVRWESGDRIPDDLTVAPAQVDMLTVMLLSVASGMKLTKYSPATGEISMSGKLGALTSSEHPILGGLLHYTPTVRNVKSRSPISSSLAAHAKALSQDKGVWANAVFGKFNDRSYGRGFQHFSLLRNTKLQVLRDNGWPESSHADSIGGAATFMAFATVDVYEAVPPTCVKQWAPHLGEVIVKSHLYQVKDQTGIDYPSNLVKLRQTFIVEPSGGTSPCLRWDVPQGLLPLGQFVTPTSPTSPPPGEASTEDSSVIPKHAKKDGGREELQAIDLASSELIACCKEMKVEDDPSTFVPLSAAYEAIMRCDCEMATIKRRVSLSPLAATFGHMVSALVVRMIRPLAEVGAPSWLRAPNITEEWPKLVATEAQKAAENFKAEGFHFKFEDVVAYAKLFMLRAAYFTVMQRAAGDLGQGLQEDTEPVTALAYLA